MTQLDLINRELREILVEYDHDNIDKNVAIEQILNIFGYSNKLCVCSKRRKITVYENVNNKCNKCKGIIISE
jgi:hypothetical protein